MGIMDRIFTKKEALLSENPSLQTLDVNKKTKIEPNPTVPKAISRRELEFVYTREPIVFNSINNIVKFSKNFYLSCLLPDGTIDRESQAIVNNRITKMPHRFSDTVASSMEHKCIFGPGYTEKVYGKVGSYIVDFKPIDPKTIDYEKNIDGTIKINPDTKEYLGYRLKIEDLHIDTFVPKEKVIQHSLYKVGSGFYPIGLIEPAFKTIWRKMNVEEAITETMFRMASPSYLLTLGNDKSAIVKANDLQNALVELEKARFSSVIVLPWTQKLEILSADLPAGVDSILDYYVNAIITSMGVPRSFAYASEGKEGQKSAKVLSQNFVRTIEMMQSSTANEFEPALAEMAYAEGARTPPKFVWTSVEREELDSKARRIEKYFASDVLTTEQKTKLISQMFKMEGLDL